MKIFWRTLLLIALCVQLPSASLAAYPSSQEHDLHQHSSATDLAGSHHHAPQAAGQDETSAADDCAAVHHCAGSHLQAISQSDAQRLVKNSGQFFDLNTEALHTSSLLPSIERPKWASI
jgi:hypothetical protein